MLKGLLKLVFCAVSFFFFDFPWRFVSTFCFTPMIITFFQVNLAFPIVFFIGCIALVIVPIVGSPKDTGPLI